MSQPQSDREQRFLAVIGENRRMLCKICYMYAADGEHFNDLYQEVLANLWQGLDTYRSEASMGTWLYRLALNTCVTYHRRNIRHSDGRVALDDAVHIEGDAGDDTHMRQLHTLYRLISGLSPLDKALILMWLDEKSYDEIADLSGLSRGNIATRLRRIKQKLVDRNSEEL
ncbi:MAG: sigma-70 family RNA polymerase sigma factor [Duncaniella sp.]|nr:sigma-70 family RNA polymerase sigma factor [Duncaniella sp.]